MRRLHFRTLSRSRPSPARPSSKSQATPAAATRSRRRRRRSAPTPVRALYVNRWATQSKKRMDEADRDRGRDGDQRVRHRHEGRVRAQLQVGESGVREERRHARASRDVSALLDTLKAHKILPIARIVVFKDSVTARVHPEWTIRTHRRFGLARQEGPRVGESVSPRAVGLQHRRRRRAGEDGLRRSAVRLHPLSRAVQESAAAGFPGLEQRVEARRDRGVSQGSEDAPQQARRAVDGGHLRTGDDRDRPARGGAALGARLTAARRGAADGVSVALSARRVGDLASRTPSRTR